MIMTALPDSLAFRFAQFHLQAQARARRHHRSHPSSARALPPKLLLLFVYCRSLYVPQKEPLGRNSALHDAICRVVLM